MRVPSQTLCTFRRRILATGFFLLVGAGGATRAQTGRLEVVLATTESGAVLTRGKSTAVSVRVRNAGDADLAVKRLEFGYAADSKDKPAPEWPRPVVVGLDGITLPKGASTNITVIFPEYPKTAAYKGQLYVTRQGPEDNPELFHTFPIEVKEPSAKTWSAKASGWIAALLAAVMLVLTIFVRVNKLNFFQSPDGGYSVSRFQVWFWTEVVLFSYAYLFFYKGSGVVFPDSIWGLLGISVGSTGVATGLAVKNDAAQAAAAHPAPAPVAPAPVAPAPVAPAPVAPAAPRPKVGAIRDMLSEDGKPSMMRLQMFAWTIATGVFFLRQVYATETLWDVPSSLLILMGISHGGYLLDKGVKIP